MTGMETGLPFSSTKSVSLKSVHVESLVLELARLIFQSTQRQSSML